MCIRQERGFLLLLQMYNLCCGFMSYAEFMRKLLNASSTKLTIAFHKDVLFLNREPMAADECTAD